VWVPSCEAFTRCEGGKATRDCRQVPEPSHRQSRAIARSNPALWCLACFAERPFASPKTPAGIPFRLRVCFVNEPLTNPLRSLFPLRALVCISLSLLLRNVLVTLSVPQRCFPKHVCFPQCVMIAKSSQIESSVWQTSHLRGFPAAAEKWQPHHARRPLFRVGRFTSGFPPMALAIHFAVSSAQPLLANGPPLLWRPHRERLK
jgi:hypothetical protein